MITPAAFKTRFSEFASVDDVRIQLFIDDAIIILNSVIWGTKYDLGLSYLTAHFLALSNKSAAGASTSNGQIASRTVDGTSVSYNHTPLTGVSDAYYSSTSYGQRYTALRKSLGVAACVI